MSDRKLTYKGIEYTLSSRKIEEGKHTAHARCHGPSCRVHIFAHPNSLFRCRTYAMQWAEGRIKEHIDKKHPGK